MTNGRVVLTGVAALMAGAVHAPARVASSSTTPAAIERLLISQSSGGTARPPRHEGAGCPGVSARAAGEAS